MSETDEEMRVRRYRTVLHQFWFEGGDKKPFSDMLDVRTSIHFDATVAEVANAVMDVARAQGYEVHGVSRTSCDELVAVEYRVENKPPYEHMPMRHRFCRPDAPWPTTPAADLRRATDEGDAGE